MLGLFLINVSQNHLQQLPSFPAGRPTTPPQARFVEPASPVRTKLGRSKISIGLRIGLRF